MVASKWMDPFVRTNPARSCSNTCWVWREYGNRLLCRVKPSNPITATPSILKVGIPYEMVSVAAGNAALMTAHTASSALR
ncbi:unannotated protein [freshwater metagenome]|uniref:Unannotated protein n=1 Tax=freshwater metagenome TaxID=449393 RepID=A0A6J6UFF7_9ZZZZ